MRTQRVVGSTTSQHFAAFLRGLDYVAGTRIVLDNASIHKTRAVRQYATTRGWRLAFIPPYSPDFNAIENVFGIVKSKLRNSADPLQDAEGVFGSVSASCITACCDRARRHALAAQ